MDTNHNGDHYISQWIPDYIYQKRDARHIAYQARLTQNLPVLDTKHTGCQSIIYGLWKHFYERRTTLTI